MIITKNYGSYIFLGEIITDLLISCEEKHTFEQIRDYIKCGECINCIKEYPTKSINKHQINPNICLSYITQKKEISDQEICLLKGNVFGCDFCQLQCPCGWRGKNVIKRNAIIGINYQDTKYDLSEFRSNSPYINDYIERLQEIK